jgi:serine/threonine protein kinase
MAPERLNGIAAPSNDIYSLGVILYQMLTGRLPERVALVSSSLPAPLEAIVRHCIAADPDDRYANATDILHSFEQACQALDVHPSPTIVLPLPAIITLQPVDEESTLEVRKPRKKGDRLTPLKPEEFGEADYVAPTIDSAHAHVGIDPGVNVQENQSPTANVADISVAVPGSRKIATRSRRRQKKLFVVTSLSIVVVLFVMVGLIFFAFPPGASASVNIGPQVHVLQQVYIITAQPSQTSIDVATTSVPAYEKVNSITSSLSGQTGQQCNQFFFRCRQVVTPVDIEYVSSQLRQALIAQLSAEMDSQLQALHATEIGTKQFTDLTESNNPALGTVSNTVTVTLTEQGSVEYINDVDVQQLANQLLAQHWEQITSS